MAIKFLNSLNADSGVLYVDADNNRVGIGTTSPSEKLEVDGIIKAVHTDNAYTKLRGTGLYFSRSNSYLIAETNNSLSLNIGDSTSRWANTRINSAYIKFENGSTENMRITSSGNVGIGTTAPSYKLQVEGEGNGLYVKGAAVAPYTQTIASFVYGGNGNSINIENQGGKASLQARESANNAMDMYINPVGGNVGIGTTSPFYKLHVSGDASVSTWLYVNNIYPTSSINDILINTGAGRTITLNPTSTGKTVIPNGNVGIGTTSPSYKLDVAGEVRADAYRIDLSATTQRALSSTGTDSLQVGDAGVNDIKFKNAAGTSFILNSSGNVGIGTTSPSEILHIIGTTNTRAIIETQVNGGSSALRLDANPNYWEIKNYGPSANLGITRGTGEFLTIDNTGNVGIGTTSPTNKLDIRPTTSGGSDVIGTGAITVGSDNPYWTLRGTATSLQDLAFDRSYSGTWYESMRIQRSTGNVGIGTVSPTSKLQVSGSGNESVEIKVSGGTTAGNTGTISLSRTDGAGSIIQGAAFLAGGVPIGGIAGGIVGSSNTGAPAFAVQTPNSTNGHIVFKPRGTEKVRIQADGNVGIGTTSPSAKLHVYNAGNSFIKIDSDATSPYMAGVEFLRSSVNGGRIYNDGGAVQVKLESYFGYDSVNPTRGGFMFKTAPVTSGTLVDAVRIDARGYVGIGTSSPTTRLHISKTDLSNELVTVRTQNDLSYADFGIQSGYARILSGGNLLYAGSNSATYFYNGGNTVMTMNYLGNVGIGTTSPTYKLDVETSDDIVASFVSTDNKASINIKDNDTSVYVSAENAKASFGFNVGVHANNLNVISSGNVGIGTSSPSLSGRGIHIENSGDAADIRLQRTDSGADLRILAGSSYAYVATNNAKALSFGANGSGNRHLTINTEGNVGIGTTSPAQKLTVAGNILQTSNSYFIATRKIIGRDNNGLDLMDDSGSNGISIKDGGNVNFTDYGSGNNTGTAAYALAIDASGNVIETTVQSSPAGIDGSGTVNYVTKWSTTDKLTSSVIYDDGTNVGINKTNPVRTLDINGSFLARTASTNLEYNNGVIYHGGSYYQFPSGSNYLLYGRSGMGLVFGSNDSEAARFDLSGNLGIGTTSPTAALHVQKAINGGFAGTIYNTQATGGFGLSVRGGNSSAEDALRVQNVGGTYLLNVKGNGNVGIGTTSPQTNLDVFSGTGGTLRLGTSDTVVLGGDTIGRIEFFSSDATNTNSGLGAFIDLVADGSQDHFNPNGDLRFGTSYASASAATTRMTIKGNGNVGIGTTSPSEKLEVLGDIRFGGSTNGDWAVLEYGTKSIQFTQSNAGSGGHEMKFRTPGWSTDAFIYTNGSTERFRITGTGNVGIGTTSPSAKLHVDGDVRITGAYYDSNNSAGTSGQVLSSTATGTDWVSLSEIQGVDGSGTTNYIAKWSDTDTIANSVIYDNGTDVGIGTTSPTRKLHVNGEAQISKLGVKSFNASYDFYNDGTTYLNGRTYLDDQVDITSGYSLNFGSSRIHSTDTSYFNGGNVGIGTTTPDAKLNVTDGGTQVTISNTYLAHLQSASNCGLAITAGASSNNYIAFGDTDDYDEGIINYNNSTRSFGFRTAGTGYDLTIDSSGNVGVGTTNPSEKLEVNGNVKADSFIGGNEAGIYTFNDTVNASASEDIFSISNQHGAQAFRVTFVCSTSGYSVAKTFEVVHSYGLDPVFFKVVDTGAFEGHDFDVTFSTTSGNDKSITCGITNNSTTVNADIATTVFLGGSPTTITVTAL